MQSNHHFFFTISLRKIKTEGEILLTLRSWTCFRLQLYRNEHFISTTKNIYCAPNGSGQLYLEKQTFTFNILQLYEEIKQICQIRLVQIEQEHQEKVLGCYQFLLNNYIKAYQELNRNCIELNVQIAQNFIIFYQVFLQKTQQALTKIIQQHEAAKKYNIQQDNLSQNESFTPDQLGYLTKDDFFKYIKIDQDKPHLFHQQYNSTKKIKRYSSIVSKGTKTSEQVDHMGSSISTQPSKLLRKRLKKTETNTSNINKINQPCSINQIQIESDLEVQDRLKAFSQLYKVIQNDSKIIQPQKLLQNQHQQQVKKDQQIVQNYVKQKRSLKRFIPPITIFILLILLVALFSIISRYFETKRYKKRSSKAQFEFHKFSSFVTPKSFS